MAEVRGDCDGFKGRWDTEEAARSAIDHIATRTALGDGKRKGMPRYVVSCGAHFHITSKRKVAEGKEHRGAP